MLTNQTINKLKEMKLVGMANGFEELLMNSASHSLSFEERFGMLVDYESSYRQNNRLKRLLKTATLQVASACVEDINFSHNRGLDQSQMASLISCNWIQQGHNLVITGPTGCGKTWLSCALGNQASRCGLSVKFHRFSLLCEELLLSHADGSFRKRLTQLAKYDLLILDDLGTSSMEMRHREDFLEILDARTRGKSTIITSQLPIDRWHEYLNEGNPTIADAIMDRITHSLIQLGLKGDSLRSKGKVKLD